MKNLLILCGALVAACADSSGPSNTPEPQLLAMGRGHICQLAGGVTTCWGAGELGQLGIGATPGDTTPVPLSDTPAFVAITAGPTHTCALDGDGAAWCWGSNSHGELGTATLADERCGAFPCQTEPVMVATTQRFSAITAGASFTCGLTTGETLLCWGLDDQGQFGAETDFELCESVRCSRAPVVAAGGARFSRISAGDSHVCALTSAGEAWCWGYDGLFKEGTHDHSFSPVPELMSDSLRFSAIAASGHHTCALDADGAGWCWGIDALGAGPSTLEADHPVRVVGGHEFREIRSARLASCGLDIDDHAYCWGANPDGAVGAEPIGGLTIFASPVPVSGGLRFSSLGGGGATFCGTTTAGELMCWGRGDEGQLLNGRKDSATPVLIRTGGA